MASVLSVDKSVSEISAPNYIELVPLSEVRCNIFNLQFRDEDITLSWSKAFLLRCKNRATSVEIHLPGKVYRINEVYESTFSVFNMVNKLPKIVFSLDLNQVDTLEGSEFSLTQCGKLNFINQNGWYCVWFAFDGGHAVIYFFGSKTKPNI